MAGTARVLAVFVLGQSEPLPGMNLMCTSVGESSVSDGYQGFAPGLPNV